MQLAGYEVRQGKHLSFRAPEQKNFTYMKSLGSYYSEENVRIRLAKNRSKAKAPKHLSREASPVYQYFPLMLRPAIEKDLNVGQNSII